MFHRTILITAGVLMLTAAGATRAVWADTTEAEVKTALAEFEHLNPKLKSFIDTAYGYAVFPSIGEGAVVIGAAHGDGLVYEKGKLIGSTSLSQVTIGFQLGGQAYRELICFQNKEALDHFRSGSYEMAADASGVALTSGVSFDAAYREGVAVYTMAKGGLMFEASIGGQKFSYKPGPG
jgi:lipid-binding SYLF domain-containing protein